MINKRVKVKILSKIAKIDKSLLFIVYILTTISTLFVYSSTRSFYFVRQNLLWILIGSLAMLIVMMIDYRITKSLIKIISIFTILILIYTKFFGITKLGARRWIDLFVIQIQPSEFVKIFLIMMFSYWIVKKFPNGINNLKDIIVAFFPGIPVILLLLMQPDLGVSLILCFSFLCILILSNANLKPIIFIALSLIALSIPIYHFVLKDYQKTRIQVFLNPEKNIQNEGWHVTQSKISIGSGKLMGRGYLSGSQSKLKFLPEPQTDFIFSVIGEEIGFLGSSFVLVLYYLLILKIIFISRLIIDDYGRLILYGIAGIFLAHVIVNVGMTIGLVPVTGKPLLFMSYGGSSFISSFIMIGLVMNIKINDGGKMNNLFIVDKEHEDMRLDKFVRKYSALKSLTQIFSFIRKGKIKVNNLKTKENYRLKLNDKINFDDILELKFDNYKKVESLNFKDMIVFEDEDIFIINKPNNIAMHKGNSHEYGLSEIAKNYFKNPNVNFANRLDLATQGLVIGTKNLQILRKISQEIKEKRVIKKYIAMVENKGLKIDEKFSVEKKIKITDKSVIISEDGKYAKTNFKVIDIKGTKALLDIELKTGRKHQIRLHLKSINLPIIGDIKYGKASDKMYLKCYFLKFLNYNISIDKVF